MKYHKVVSSNIQAIAHEKTTLGVQFKGGVTYLYENVSPEIYKQIKTANSVGQVFNQLVKSNPELYPFSKVV